MSADTQVLAYRNFLKRFVGRSPVRWSGGGFPECAHCGGEMDDEVAGDGHSEHCLWVEGRRMLGHAAAETAERDGVVQADELEYLCEHIGLEYEEISRDNLHRVVEAVVFDRGVPLLLRQREAGVFWLSDIPKAA